MADIAALTEMINGAIAAHGAWKARLAAAIKDGRSEFSVDVVGKDDQCAFGKWLYGGIDPTVKRSEHYAKVRTLHASFHRTAAGVLGMAVAGKAAEATTAMGPGSDFSRASSQITLALTAWRGSLG